MVHAPLSLSLSQVSPNVAEENAVVEDRRPDPPPSRFKKCARVAVAHVCLVLVLQ